MSNDLTDLIAVYSFAIVGIFLSYYTVELSVRFGERMVAAAQADPPAPKWFRTRMLFRQWLPYQAGGFLIQVLHIIVFVEMLDYVDNEGARTIAYLLIWTCVLMALIMVITMTVGLSEYRKHLLGSQAEAD
jgi:hypothetical protein